MDIVKNAAPLTFILPALWLVAVLLGESWKRMSNWLDDGDQLKALNPVMRIAHRLCRREGDSWELFFVLLVAFSVWPVALVGVAVIFLALMARQKRRDYKLATAMTLLNIQAARVGLLPVEDVDACCELKGTPAMSTSTQSNVVTLTMDNAGRQADT